MDKKILGTFAGIAMLSSIEAYSFFHQENKYPEVVQKNNDLETIFGEYDRFNNLLEETFEKGTVVSKYKGKPFQYKLDEGDFNILLEDTNQNGTFDGNEILGISQGNTYSCSNSIKITPLENNLYNIENPGGYCIDRETKKREEFQTFNVDDLVDLISKN